MRTVEVKNAEQKKLATVDTYGWYIMNAMRYKITTMTKAINDAKKSQVDDAKLGLSATDPRAEGLQAMLDHVEHMLREYQEAYDALVKAGID